MALSTYSDLQASLANWLERADLGMFIPEFIALFEAKVNRTLRVGAMETTEDLTGTDGVFDLPTGFLGARKVASTFGPLEQASPEWAAERYPTNTGGLPRYYTIVGSKLTVFPASNSLTLVYYKALPALSDAAPANWLLTSHPDAYLFGSLVEAGTFVSDPVKAEFYAQRTAAAFDEIRSQDIARRFSNAVARVKGPTP